MFSNVGWSGEEKLRVGIKALEGIGGGLVHPLRVDVVSFLSFLSIPLSVL